MRTTQAQRQFIFNYLRGMSGTEAAVAAYRVNSRATAAVIASENLRKPNIIAAINALAPKGFILENSIRAISDGLSATKGVKQLPDHRTQLKAAAMGLKLLNEIYR